MGTFDRAKRGKLTTGSPYWPCGARLTAPAFPALQLETDKRRDATREHRKGMFMQPGAEGLDHLVLRMPPERSRVQAEQRREKSGHKAWPNVEMLAHPGSPWVVRVSEVHESSVGDGNGGERIAPRETICDAEYAANELLMLDQGGGGELRTRCRRIISVRSSPRIRG
jgi:hypothetical protein